MQPALVCLILLAFGSVLGQAEQYWIAYEGNDFPENEGWVRYASDPPAERWLEDGSLFIDSRADIDITENYTMYFDGGLDPEPGETFIMRWRLEVLDAYPWEDPGVYVISDEQHAVALIFAEGYVLSAYEGDVWANFEPGVPHEFELQSADMGAYRLYIDGQLAMQGIFHESLFPTCAGWGDVVRGGTSLAAWDRFRFGVVPEPDARVLYALALLARRNLT